MSRYILTEKIKKILEARGYELVCKICDCPLIAGLSREQAEKENRPEAMGEEIESKQQRRGKSKLYHASCYDKSHFQSEEKEETDEELEKFFSLPTRHKAMSRKLIKRKHKRNKRKRKRRRARSK